MYQVLGPKVIVAMAAWAALSLLTIFGAGLPVGLRIIVCIVDIVLLTVLLSNPVWRFVWNRTGPIGAWLSRNIYPDLNKIVPSAAFISPLPVLLTAWADL